ncbi:MAG: hypothetical protein ACXW2X_09625, partial [Thermoanaerobaculia bacterium]
MIATAPADSRDGSFDDAVSVAFCRDAEDSGDCIDGMFAQQGINAMRLAVVVCVMQQAAAQPGRR